MLALPHTIRIYRRNAACFRAFVGKPLRLVILGDLQALADSFEDAPGMRARVFTVIKSLLTFAAKLGTLRFNNVGAALRTPAHCDGLADRTRSEVDVARMLTLIKGPNPAFIRLADVGSFRVAQLVGLRWSDLAAALPGSRSS